MGGIFDHPQIVITGERRQVAVAHRQAGEVDRQHGSGGFGDRRLCGLQVEVEGDRVDVDQNRFGPQVADHLGGRCERPGRDDHLVAWSDAGCLQRQMEAGRSRVDRDGLDAAADVFGELELERRGLRAGRQPASPQRVHDGGDLVLADVRYSKRQELFGGGQEGAPELPERFQQSQAQPVRYPSASIVSQFLTPRRSGKRQPPQWRERIPGLHALRPAHPVV
jgi:hypothetical protein